ncbi:IclR family transcriptional regulator [Cellulomonas sp. WB94]|uniref:IclR family transcriptional regulator n=1 Tax=Cellulomonas sp. WB94 TaxID=2173174 RepID=UPI000D587E64|nr:IclR family transcriptional regulator [Cellulomonas sp. WB94]PVU82205.1 IclR family transcriptional regulator [Cellulomonas sp. WB94]
MTSERPGTTIQSVERAARLLLEIAAAPDGLSAKELAARFDLTVPTAHNLLRTLAAEGLLEKDDAHRYVLGPLAAVIAYRVAASSRPPAAYRDAMNAVARETGETSYLGTWRAGRVVLVASAPSSHSLQVVASPLGSSDGLHARATGKLMLALARPDVREAAMRGMTLTPITPRSITDPQVFEAELATIRETHVAHDDEEFVTGAHGVSVPIWAGGIAVACLSVHAPVDRYRANAERILEIMQREARRASRPLPGGG